MVCWYKGGAVCAQQTPGTCGWIRDRLWALQEWGSGVAALGWELWCIKQTGGW